MCLRGTTVKRPTNRPSMISPQRATIGRTGTGDDNNSCSLVMAMASMVIVPCRKYIPPGQ